MNNLAPSITGALPQAAIYRLLWLRDWLRRLTAYRDCLNALGYATLVNALLFTLFFSFITPGYQTDDDLGMQWIASGVFTGHPSEHLLFSNFILGWGLRLL